MGVREVWNEGDLQGWTVTSLSADQSEGPSTKEKVKVVYQIPCSCGKSYIGETRRSLETRMSEHKEACLKGTLEKSAVAEHAWKDHHTIKWEETTVVDMARHPRKLLLKETIHIQITPAEECLNSDTGLELPGCWAAALTREEDLTNRAGPTPTDRLRANGDHRGCGTQA